MKNTLHKIIFKNHPKSNFDIAFTVGIFFDYEYYSSLSTVDPVPINMLPVLNYKNVTFYSSLKINILGNANVNSSTILTENKIRFVN